MTASREDPCCAIVDLRQYSLHPGRRDILINLFDREFVESQNACGIHVVGQFRDLDDPDRFVWLRGFTDNDARGEALAAFYGGPAWKLHREAANATMIDSSDVLMLRPVYLYDGYPTRDAPRTGAAGLVTATICPLATPADDVVAFFVRDVEPVLVACGASLVALFRTEPAPNTFPALPVRTGENVLAWFARFADAEQHAVHLRALDTSSAWTDDVLPRLTGYLDGTPQHLRLAPTSRSQLR